MASVTTSVRACWTSCDTGDEELAGAWPPVVQALLRLPLGPLLMAALYCSLTGTSLGKPLMVGKRGLHRLRATAGSGFLMERRTSLVMSLSLVY